MFFYPEHQYLFESSLLGQNGDVITPSSTSNHTTSLMYQFSPPTLDHDGFNDLLLVPHILPTNAPQPSTDKGTCLTITPCRKPTCTARKRGLRKDRHSKIVTAQGTRDRRMRLSLDVAKKFFDLQDMLGYDKASKTVQWLLTKSAKAIKALAICSASKHRGCSSGNAKTDSSSSECEVNSSSPATKPPGDIHFSSKSQRATTARPPRNPLPGDPTLARESRVKARARARARTREKRMRDKNGEDGSEQLKQFASSSTFPLQATGEVDTGDMKSSLELVADAAEEPSKYSPYHRNPAADEGDDESMLAIATGESGGISINDYNLGIINGGGMADTYFFPEQWNMHLLGNLEEQRGMVIDVPFQVRPWEGFNNQSIL